MKLTELMEQFLDTARRPMTFNRLPIDAKEPDTPVIPMDRWEFVKGAGELIKTYSFMKNEQRDDFIRAVLAYENTVQHRARITIDDGSVMLVLITKGANRITELDKEYATYADILYKDVVYNSRYGF